MGTTEQLVWGDDACSVVVGWDASTAPALLALRTADAAVELPSPRPVLEVLTVAEGRSPGNQRLVETLLGARARHVGHRDEEVEGGRRLTLELVDETTGLEAEVAWTRLGEVPVLRAAVRLRNGGTQPVVVRSVVSFVTPLGRPAGSGAALGVRGWSLHRGLSDWLGEGRWVEEPCDATRFPDLREDLTGINPRGAQAVVSTGTWSSGTHLPTAAAVSTDLGLAWAWQVEHNGGWRFELGQDTADGYLAAGGPTDTDHQWVKVLRTGEELVSVPVAVTLAPDLTRAFAQLTRYRRAARRPHPDSTALPVVFNDYMNTLTGDPTTERLLPLIDAAAAAGAEVFCVDAGWYDDSGHWWDSVGEWRPSTTRFPGGLDEVVERIRSHGMIAGLWLEPEVVGVRSPLADRLPPEAFLQRHGQRVVESGRYHLDLRHPAARAHLDEVVDRLVTGLGVGYFKLDYNINPGAGTDLDADSVGDGLLAHNRAHLAWLDGVLDRHPELVLENCGSGAMRSDFAVLSRLQLQSTSDQQDPLRYPTVAAAAPASMLPEQAASWAYPQPGMTPEEAAFTLTTGLAGRIYLSGYLNRMTPDELALVQEAVRLAKDLRGDLVTSVPCWPTGLPRWDDPWVSLGLVSGDRALVLAWAREEGPSSTTLDLGGLADLGLPLDGGLRVEQLFPAALPAWGTEWDAEGRRLTVRNPTDGPSARVFRVTAGGREER